MSSSTQSDILYLTYNDNYLHPIILRAWFRNHALKLQEIKEWSHKCAVITLYKREKGIFL